jgi:hypothetical protein
MKRILTLSIVMPAFALVLTAAPRADVTRTVYFSAVDGKGTPITDLTAADLTVKEGGKSYPIAALKPAPDPLQVFLVVDDSGSGYFQGGVAQFLQSTLGHAEVAISVLNPQPNKVANFTADVETLKTALGRIGPRGKILSDGEQIIEAVADAAKDLQQRQLTSRAIVVLTVGGEKAQSDMADAALNSLKASGASLNVLSITGVDLGKLLGDGPKASGGLVQQSSGTGGLGPVLAKLADTLLHQYVLTYTLPDGAKPSDKLALATSRKGVTLLAPSRIPDK